MNNKNEILRNLPQVDEILNEEKIKVLDSPHDFLVNCVREVITDIRSGVLDGKIDRVDKERIVSDVLNKLNKKSKPSFRRVINATGTVLHTNLGRSVISEKASNAILEVANNYSNLEYNVEKGERGDRHSHIEKLIKDLTGCEAAMVVNNNAAATTLVLAAMAPQKEVIISRGELIEIGGSFRIPDVMSESSAFLKEVGATNKTHISDYKKAYNENTAAIMKVHTSNYRIVGFTEEVTLKELSPLSKELNVPLIYDMGNGLFVDLSKYGIDEPTVPNLVKEGADVVLFSGDKLLGGPQAGIIIGKEKYINKMKKHPLARAFRVDKYTIAALYATLFEYFDEKKALKNIPILDMITATKEALKERAEKLKNLFDKSYEASIEEVKDQVGGGTAPNVYLDSYAVAVDRKDLPSEKLERKLRELDIPIIARISHDKVLFDIRTIRDNEIELVAKEVNSI